MRTNPETGIYSGYYRLVESYRNSEGRVNHRTILNAGYLDALNTDQLNLIQKILTEKVNNPDTPLFDISYTDDAMVMHYAEMFYNRMVSEKRIDVVVDKQHKQPSAKGKDLHTIDINSIRNKDVKEIDAEWMTYQAMQQLQIALFLEQQGWSGDDIRLAQSHIIASAVYPASELETSRWMKEKSSLCEVTGYNIDEVTKDQLHFGLLAYWVVNTVRYQLKTIDVKSGWKEIVRIMITQKAVTTTTQIVQDAVIMIRRCSEPNQNVRKIYDALKYKYAPFVKKKYVVHKSELDNSQFIEKQYFSLV